MIYFNSDYLEGAHPKVMALMNETNMEQTGGYGEDAYCDRAGALIKEACQAPDAYVQFLVGGTQTNLTVIAAALRPHQGVLCAETGHIEVHETGSIEACGHKVLALPGKDGKLSAEQVRRYVETHRKDPSFEHMVQPGMVYISHPTEVGTLYSTEELTELSKTCRELGLYLFLDGARLAYGLAVNNAQSHMGPTKKGISVENNSESSDGEDVYSDMLYPDLPAIARLCDVFYIGGTKCGALMGEAVVITNDALKKDFRYIIKQKGGMLAKGRLLGLQFIALFEKESEYAAGALTAGERKAIPLYYEIGAHAIRLADKLRQAITEAGIPFYQENPTNQIFVILTDAQTEVLSQKFVLSFTERIDENHAVMRICTSWATTEENVDKLITALCNIAR